MRWRRIRWPSTSSSSQPRRRGHARASASWASSTVPSSLVTSRARRGARSAARARVGGEQAPQVPGGGPARLRAGRDQPQQQVAQDAPLLGRRLVVDLLGRLRDRPADAAGLAVAGDGERPALAPLPGLRSACDNRGSAPGSPSTSRTRRSTRPGSRSRPPGGPDPRLLLAARRRPSRPAGTGCARPAGRTPGVRKRRPGGRRAARPPAGRARRARRGQRRTGLVRRCRRTASSLPRTGRRRAPARDPTSDDQVSASIGWAPGVITTTRSPARVAAPLRSRPARATTSPNPTARSP